MTGKGLRCYDFVPLPIHIFRFSTILQYPLCHSTTINWAMSFFSTLQSQIPIMKSAKNTN